MNEENIYKNAGQPIKKRVEDLLSRMTLKEKIGQLNMPIIFPAIFAEIFGIKMLSNIDDFRKSAKGLYEKEIGPAGGFFSITYLLSKESSLKQAEGANELQKIAVEKTRLGIPLMFIEEGTHGGVFGGATIFPEGPTIGSNWNIDLIEKIYSASASEARSIGIHALCSLVVEPTRDPRIGRNEEGYSEDTYMCSRIAEAIVRGAQADDIAKDNRVVSVLCHFPGQSEPVGGLEHGAMEISERKLREIFLPPWVAGIKRAGALGVMATYPVIDDLPVHASEKLLTKLLRDELGFKGIVLSEGNGFKTLEYNNIAANSKEAGAIAIKAGIDVSITYEEAFLKPLIENVEEGIVQLELIDRAVSRVLETKFRLGLFESPYVNSERAAEVIHSEEHQKIALQTAREGIVLLKNEKNLLPLSKDIKSIAVLGPNVNDISNQLGDYTSEFILQPVITVLDGIKQKLSSDTKINYAEGCKVTGDDKRSFAKAVKAARNSDIAVVVVGEQQGRGESMKGATNGERFDVASLDLSGVQEDLIKAVYETGTPTVVVLINGRPLSIRWTAKYIPAIIEAWLPGEKGGSAIADILFGDCNPSGRLPITIPYHVGQVPLYYNYKPSKDFISALIGFSDRLMEIVLKEWGMDKYAGYIDMPMKPLYEFGYGLSYTTFKYSNLKINTIEIAPDENTKVGVDITNTGKLEGKEVVQLYIHDKLSSVVQPVKQLRGFEKISLKPGDTKTVTFTLTPKDLQILNQDMQWVVEPGEFEIMVGSSSEKIHLKGILTVKN